MTLEMAESDSKTAVNNFWHPFSHSKWICTVLLSPCAVHLCVHMCVHVHTCSRHPPERLMMCALLCSLHACAPLHAVYVCVLCSSRKFIHLEI